MSMKRKFHTRKKMAKFIKVIRANSCGLPHIDAAFIRLFQRHAGFKVTGK